MAIYEGLIIDIDPLLKLGVSNTNLYIVPPEESFQGYPIKFGEEPIPIERPDSDESTEWLGTWANRVPIVIDHTRVNENLIDYPLLIMLNDTMVSGTSDNNLSTLLDLDFDSGLFGDDWIDNSNIQTVGYSLGGMILQTTATSASTAGANITSDEYWPTNGIYTLEFDWTPVAGSSWYDDDNSDAAHYIQFTVTSPTYDPDAWRYTKLTSTNISVYLRSTKSNVITVEGNSKSFSYGALHAVKIILDCDSKLIYLYMDDVFQMARDVTSKLASIGSNFKLNFHWHNYNKSATQKYDNMVFYRQVVVPYPYKIAVTKSDGITQLPVEIISYRPAEESPVYATKVPKVFLSNDTKLYFYYDKTQPDNVAYVGATRDTIAQTVWDSNYISVINMSDTLVLDEVKDSTSVGVNGNPYSLLTTNSVEGIVGYSIDFDGGADYISFSHTSYMSVRDSGMTFEFLVIPKGYSSGARLYEQGYYDGFHINIGATGNFGFGINIGGSGGWQGWSSNFIVPLNEPSYLVVTVDDNNEIKFYLNAQTSVPDTASYSYNTPDSTSSIAIGAQIYGADANHYEGEMDFFRRSIGIRSEAWIKATNYNLTGQLYTIGTEEHKAAYYYHGYVTQLDLPAARQVRLYHRDTGTLMDETTSRSSDGYYYLTTSISGSHYVVVLDDDAGDDYNALISDRLGPLGIE